MKTRKEQLFSASTTKKDASMISATVKFVHNKKVGELNPLPAKEKMLCALRKCLAKMSDQNETGCRYYIANNQVEVTKEPTTTDGKRGEGKSYHAEGRCKLGVAHDAGHTTSLYVEFSISYRDSIDDRGLADIVYFEPTTVDVIDRGGPVDLSHLR